LSTSEVEAYLREHIPLSASMGVAVVEAAPERVVLEAPIGPNLNHRSTAFGGSVAALAILAGWTLVHLRLRAEGLVAQTVIQTSDVRYDAPVHGAFQAATEPIEPAAWARFTKAIQRHGKGRVHVSVAVWADGVAAAGFTGAYVAIAGRKSAGDL
jgi:thioesterase domain-containing protein